MLDTPWKPLLCAPEALAVWSQALNVRGALHQRRGTVDLPLAVAARLEVVDHIPAEVSLAHRPTEECVLALELTSTAVAPEPDQRDIQPCALTDFCIDSTESFLHPMRIVSPIIAEDEVVLLDRALVTAVAAGVHVVHDCTNTRQVEGSTDTLASSNSSQASVLCITLIA